MEYMTTVKASPLRRFFRFIFKAIFYFVIGSVLIVCLYAFVPVPTTITMLTDSNGAERKWASLTDISPNLARAMIAAEDSKFCSHDGFDREAIEKR